MRTPKQRTIYNNYDLWESYPDEEIKIMLIENGTDESEITDDIICEERYFLDSIDWAETKETLENFFLNKGNKWMLFGEVERWDGVFKCGTLFETFDDFFYEAAKDCGYIHFYDEDGHLFLECSHHDGTNLYEIKKVTDKGLEYLKNWENNWNDKRTEEYIHTQIFNRYSKLPRFAERIWLARR